MNIDFDDDESVPRETLESVPRETICSWCDGSGQDYRNIEWRCQKCLGKGVDNAGTE